VSECGAYNTDHDEGQLLSVYPIEEACLYRVALSDYILVKRQHDESPERSMEHDFEDADLRNHRSQLHRTEIDRHEKHCYTDQHDRVEYLA